MRFLKLSSIGLIALVFFACQKDVQKTSEEVAVAGKASPGSSACGNYVVDREIIYDDVNDQTTFIWSINNPKPGNGKNGTTQDLSHWTFEAGECLTQYWGAVMSMAYKYGSGAWTDIQPLPQIQPDPSQTCTNANVVKFDFGTSGSTTTYYKMVLSGKWNGGLTNIYFKSGANTGCCQKVDMPGVGCVEESDCSMSQGYWFAKPQVIWPSNVTIGGKSYTQAEGKAIWDFSNAGGIRDSKKAFTQAAAIKLSNVSDPVALADVAIIDAWLSSIGKLSPAYMPNQTPAEILMYGDAAAAAGRIGQWINTHHCE